MAHCQSIFYRPWSLSRAGQSSSSVAVDRNCAIPWHRSLNSEVRISCAIIRNALLETGSSALSINVGGLGKRRRRSMYLIDANVSSSDRPVLRERRRDLDPHRCTLTVIWSLNLSVSCILWPSKRKIPFSALPVDSLIIPQWVICIMFRCKVLDKIHQLPIFLSRNRHPVIWMTL